MPHITSAYDSMILTCDVQFCIRQSSCFLTGICSYMNSARLRIVASYEQSSYLHQLIVNISHR